MTIDANHQILIVSRSTARITAAARMLRKGFADAAVTEAWGLREFTGSQAAPKRSASVTRRCVK